MEIAVIGVNHRTASIEAREQLALNAASAADSPGKLVDLASSRYVREAVVLSTCNRTEIYGAVEGPPAFGEDEMIDILTTRRGIPREAFEPHIYSYSGMEAARHLFRVVSGLDSMILGEVQIVGQTRLALERARAGGIVGPVLSRVFSRALTVGGNVRFETNIGRGAASVSYAAAELAERMLGTLESRKLLLIGAGKVGELSARALLKKGARSIAVTSRTHERAAALARKTGGEMIDLASLGDVLHGYDIVISATTAPHFVITHGHVAGIAARRATPILLIDLGVPRDIEPEAAGVDGVWLYNVDDLGMAVKENLSTREGERNQAYAIVERELDDFEAWWASIEAIPVARTLRQQAEQIRETEVSRAFRKLAHLSDDDKQIVEALTGAIVKKLLHSPTVNLKAGKGVRPASWYQDAATELFDLDGEMDGACRGRRPVAGTGRKA